MKIAFYTTNRTTLPPEKNVIAASAHLTSILTNRLVDKGHDVTLYAPKGSVSKAKIVDLDLMATGLDFGIKKEAWVLKASIGMKQIYLGELYKRSGEYDIIHLQTEPAYLGMPFSRISKTPTVFTNHNPFLIQEKEIFEFYKDLPITTLSYNQQKTFPDLNYVANIYNGIEASKYPFNDFSDKNSHMIFVGRLVEQKGILDAISAAKLTQKKLIISGRGEKDFMSEHIVPELNENIENLGLVELESDIWFDRYKNSRATLFPIRWEEPFGLVMIESMACGTPVIAYANGSTPEIIEDGVNGFLVNASDENLRGSWITKQTGIEGLCEAINRIYSMPDDEYKQMRKAARKHVEENFTSDKMVDEYEKVYEQILSSTR